MSTFGIHCPICWGRGSLSKFEDKAFPIGNYTPEILITGLSGTECSICQDHTFDEESEKKYTNTYKVIKSFDRACITDEWITIYEKYLDNLKGGNNRLTYNPTNGTYMHGWDDPIDNSRKHTSKYNKKDLCTAFRLILIEAFCK
jgi:hypothetical protein